MGVGVGKLYLHTVRPATATQSGQTPRRMPVPSQAADTHADKPQTDTQSDHRQGARKPSHTYSHSQATKGAACKITRTNLARGQTTHADRHEVRPRTQGVRRDTHAET